MRTGRGKADTLTALASWATPASRDVKDCSDPDTWDCKEDRNRMDQLGRQVHLTAGLVRLDTSQTLNGVNTTGQALLTSGPTPNGSNAATESGGPFQGQLNPTFGGWWRRLENPCGLKSNT